MPVSVCRTLGESRGAVSGRDGKSGWLFLRGLSGGLAGKGSFIVAGETLKR